MLRLSNEQSQLHTKKIILENEVKAMEDKLDAIKTQLRDKDVLVSQLKLCVNNLYAQLCRRLGIPPAVINELRHKSLEQGFDLKIPFPLYSDFRFKADAAIGKYQFTHESTPFPSR